MKQAARAREEDQIRAISEMTTVRRENSDTKSFKSFSFPLTNTNTHAESKTIR